MKDYGTLYSAVLAYAHDHNLPIKVVRKRSSALMWILYIISLMWIWNRRFMDGFITTFAGHMWVPDDFDPVEWSAWRTLAHELVHVRQEKEIGGLWWGLGYLFPLPLVLGVLGTFWCPWALFFLLALAPLPAPWRVKYEREAYFITALCDALMGMEITSAEYIDYQVENYCGFGYYRMAWRRSRMRELVRQDMEYAKAVLSGHLQDPYAQAIMAIYKGIS